LEHYKNLNVKNALVRQSILEEHFWACGR